MESKREISRSTKKKDEIRSVSCWRKRQKLELACLTETRAILSHLFTDCMHASSLAFAESPPALVAVVLYEPCR
jgi:hypothetical protein